MTEQQRQQTYAQMLVRLSRSNFRSRFHLKAQDKQYIRDKGMEYDCRPRGRFCFQAAAPAEPKNDGKQTPVRGTSGVHRAARYRLLLPRLSGEMAWHPQGRAAFGGAAGLYRWNADELDEERNGKLRMENGKLA